MHFGSGLMRVQCASRVKHVPEFLACTAAAVQLWSLASDLQRLWLALQNFCIMISRTVHTLAPNLHNDALCQVDSKLKIANKLLHLLVGLRWWAPEFTGQMVPCDMLFPHRCALKLHWQNGFCLPFYTCNIWLSIGISSRLAYATVVQFRLHSRGPQTMWQSRACNC